MTEALTETPAVVPDAAAETPSEPVNLLDMGGDDAGTETTESSPANETSANEESGQWNWAEGITGNGDKPEWLQDRYKSVSDQAKAYKELEKKFGEFKGAPKDGYDLEAIPLDKDNKMLNTLSETFKELNMSQSGFERVVSEFMTAQTQMSDMDMQAEIAKLGPKANSMIKQTNTRLTNNFDKGVADTVKSWIQTSDDILALNALLSNQTLSSIPNNNAMQQVITTESYSTLKDEKVANYDRYQTDETYAKSLNERIYWAQQREKKG